MAAFNYQVIHLNNMLISNAWFRFFDACAQVPPCGWCAAGGKKTKEKWQKEFLFAYLIQMYINFEITSFLCYFLLVLFCFGSWFTFLCLMHTTFLFHPICIYGFDRQGNKQYTIREWKCVCLFDAFAVECFGSEIYLSLKLFKKCREQRTILIALNSKKMPAIH